MLLSMLAWIVVGVAVGWLASVIVRDTSVGIVGAALIGALGAVIGGAIYVLFGSSSMSDFDGSSVVVAFIGSVVLLLLVRLLAINARIPRHP